MKIFFGSVSKHPEKIWIIDELYNAMKSNLKYHEVTDNPEEAQIMVFDGCRIVMDDIKIKKNIFGIYIVHHIEPTNSKNYNISMGKVSKCVKVINYIGKDDEGTQEFIKSYKDKVSIHQPFGINTNFCCLSDKMKLKLRKDYKIPADIYVIGSFIRSCEKASKNIDFFFQCVLYLKKIKEKVFLFITGEERNLTINFCKTNKIPYIYKNVSDYEEMNNIYNCLDLYIITSRAEGAPMQLYECALTKTPQVSTRVGNVSSILKDKSIIQKPTLEAFKAAYKNIDVEVPFKNVQKYKIHDYFYDNFIDNCLKAHDPNYIKEERVESHILQAGSDIEDLTELEENVINDLLVNVVAEVIKDEKVEDIEEEFILKQDEISEDINIDLLGTEILNTKEDDIQNNIIETELLNTKEDIPGNVEKMQIETLSEDSGDEESLEEIKKNKLKGMDVNEIEVIDTKFKINIFDKKDLIQKEIVEKKNWEPNLTKVMYELYKEDQREDKIFMDCGANIGFFSLLMASMGANVVSIEMDETLCKELKKNFKLNHFKNYIIFNNALSNVGGDTLYFEQRSKNNRGSQLIVESKTSHKTESVTLDQVINELKANSIFLMKLDIEGYEIKALEGLVDNFNKINYFIIELAKKIKPTKEILKIVKIFLGKNYKIYDLGYYNQIKNFDMNTFSYKNCNVVDSTNYKKYVENMYHLTNFLFIKM